MVMVTYLFRCFSPTVFYGFDVTIFVFLFFFYFFDFGKLV